MSEYLLIFLKKSCKIKTKEKGVYLLDYRKDTKDTRNAVFTAVVL